MSGDHTAPGSPYEDFQDACVHVLTLLQKHYPMGLWMVTRAVEDDWIVLESADVSYDVAAGDAFRWSDSFCSRMVSGEGPRVAPDSSAVPAYAAAPIGQAIPIASYIGFPLIVEGELFGTLCAIDQHSRPEQWDVDSELLETLTRLLSTVLQADLRSGRLALLAEALRDEAHRDHLTGALNRRGWDRLVEQAQANLDAFGTQYAALIVDLDGLKQINDDQGHAAGDQLLQDTSRQISLITRDADVVARLGGDEFGVLLDEPLSLKASAFVGRLQDALESSGIEASIGWARTVPGQSMEDVISLADERMYENKRARQA